MEIRRLGEHEVARYRSIRLRALQDAPGAFATTLDECLTWSEMTWSSQLSGIAAFVAVSAGADVGLVRGAPDRERNDAGWLISMWVAPDARRKGVGGALVEEVVRWARSQGYDRLFLDVAENNGPAISLYERKGFRPSGEAKLKSRPEHGLIHELGYVRVLTD